MFFWTLAFLSGLASLRVASAASCVGEINSLDDIATASKCNTINVNAFTVPAGVSFNLTSLLSGTSVALQGNVTFGAGVFWTGPLFQISGTNITFDGQGNWFDGNGPFYWDGQGTNGGFTKPDKMVVVKNSGVFMNLNILNAPSHVVSVGNKAPLLITNILINNTFGNFPNNQSDGLPAGHNTDGFDVSASNVTITNSTVLNQDDCVAINSGSNIIFSNNVCVGGHGISVGSIKTGDNVANVFIDHNVIVNEQNGLRIKTEVNATSATVTNVTYSGNVVVGATQFGVIIEQDYTNNGPTGVPTDGVLVSSINFVGDLNFVSLIPGAQQYEVLCGDDSCLGTWDWSSVFFSGGDPGISNYDGIIGLDPPLNSD